MPIKAVMTMKGVFALPATAEITTVTLVGQKPGKWAERGAKPGSLGLRAQITTQLRKEEA